MYLLMRRFIVFCDMGGGEFEPLNGALGHAAPPTPPTPGCLSGFSLSQLAPVFVEIAGFNNNNILKCLYLVSGGVNQRLRPPFPLPPQLGHRQRGGE